MKKILSSVTLFVSVMMAAQNQGLSQQVNHGPRLGLVWCLPWVVTLKWAT